VEPSSFNETLPEASVECSSFDDALGQGRQDFYQFMTRRSFTGLSLINNELTRFRTTVNIKTKDSFAAGNA